MRGIAVTLYTKASTETDPFGAPIWIKTAVTVDNVLIGQPTTEEITASTDLYGKRIDYVLGIPKGDTHDWTDKRVEWTDAYGRTIKAQTIGFPVTGVAELIPGPWHMKVRCSRIE